MRKTWLWTLIGMVGLVAVSYVLFLWLSAPALPEGFRYGNDRIEATEVTESAEVGGRVLESAQVDGRSVQANEQLVRLDEAGLNTRLKHYQELREIAYVSAQMLDRVENQQRETLRRAVPGAVRAAATDRGLALAEPVAIYLG